MLETLYTRLARARRRYYARRPFIRRRLAAPVISVGNLTVGGSGKTPLAAAIAKMLVDAGERPSILSRGYGRQVQDEGVVVVSDGRQVLADITRAGDEPLMLARQLPGVPVLVCPSRYLAGRIAETRLGCTVHILDDGFQHFELMRDIDLLVAPDRSDARTLPFGRLREPLDAAAAADALLVDARAEALGHRDQSVRAEALGHREQDAKGEAPGSSVAQGFSPVQQPVFTFSRHISGPAPDRPAFAFAGIARPERFYDDLERAGWRLTGRRSFRDHHHYTPREIEDIGRAAAESGAAVILTTEKDYVRLQLHPGMDIVPVPLDVTLEPPFASWLAVRLRAARTATGGAA